MMSEGGGAPSLLPQQGGTRYRWGAWRRTRGKAGCTGRVAGRRLGQPQLSAAEQAVGQGGWRAPRQRSGGGSSSRARRCRWAHLGGGHGGAPPRLAAAQRAQQREPRLLALAHLPPASVRGAHRDKTVGRRMSSMRTWLHRGEGERPRCRGVLPRALAACPTHLPDRHRPRNQRQAGDAAHRRQRGGGGGLAHGGGLARQRGNVDDLRRLRRRRRRRRRREGGRAGTLATAGGCRAGHAHGVALATCWGALGPGRAPQARPHRGPGHTPVAAHFAGCWAGTDRRYLAN